METNSSRVPSRVCEVRPIQINSFLCQLERGVLEWVCGSDTAISFDQNIKRGSIVFIYGL